MFCSTYRIFSQTKSQLHECITSEIPENKDIAIELSKTGGVKFYDALCLRSSTISILISYS